METLIVYAANPVVILVGLAAAYVGMKVLVSAIRSKGGNKYEVDVSIHK